MFYIEGLETTMACVFYVCSCHVQLGSIGGTEVSLTGSEYLVVVLIRHRLYICLFSHVRNVIFG